MMSRQRCGRGLIAAQGTIAEGAIQKLFVGKMKSYIKCVDVDYESSRIEEFNGACATHGVGRGRALSGLRGQTSR
jgi:hypothetical protein